MSFSRRMEWYNRNKLANVNSNAVPPLTPLHNFLQLNSCIELRLPQTPAPSSSPLPWSCEDDLSTPETLNNPDKNFRESKRHVSEMLSATDQTEKGFYHG